MPNSQKTQVIETLNRTVDTITARHAMLSDDNCENSAGPQLKLGLSAIDATLDGGLELAACHEIRAELARDIAAATGYLTALLTLLSSQREGHVVWVMDAAARTDSGLPYPHGLEQFGFDPARLLFVHPIDFKSALWAAGEAIKCGDVLAAIFHIKGNPAMLDLTATRRLMLHASQNATTLFILRQSGKEEASSVLTRWRVRAAQSQEGQEEEAFAGIASTHDFIGPTRLALTLEKNRNGSLGEWSIAWHHSQRMFTHAEKSARPSTTATGRKSPPAYSGPASAPSGDRPHRPDEMGQIMESAGRFRQAS